LDLSGGVTGLKKLHKELLHNLQSSPDIIRVIKEDDLGGVINVHGSDDKFTIFIGKPEENKPRHRWKMIN
jgi:hypothetical protein